MDSVNHWLGERFNFIKLPAVNILRLAARQRYSVAKVLGGKSVGNWLRHRRWIIDIISETGHRN